MNLHRNLSLLLVLLLAGCTTKQEEPAPSPPKPEATPAKPEEPKKKKNCGIEEETGKGLIKSTLQNSLSEERAKSELDGLNDICGDVWCEGSFEYFFHGLRCNAKKKLCHLDLRMYDRQRTKKKVPNLKRSGKGFVSRVLAQIPRDCCTHPGITDNLEPCTTYDVRCELKTRIGKDSFPEAFHNTLSNCLNTLEDGIRKIVPEFSEEPE